MPEGLEEGLTNQDLADLLDFVLSDDPWPGLGSRQDLDQQGVYYEAPANFILATNRTNGN